MQESHRLRERLDQVVAANLNLSALLIRADARSTELVKLFVSVRALIESRDAVAALAGVQDILVNVIGTSEFVIYSLDGATGDLIPIVGNGEAFNIAVPVRIRGSWLGEIVANGEVMVPPGSRPRAGRSRVDNVAAVVPLRVLDRVLGAIVIARMLPHRDLLDFCDREVLGLLGAYAATAIIAADRRTEWHQLPVIRS
jgi:hypothetical protein